MNSRQIMREVRLQDKAAYSDDQILNWVASARGDGNKISSEGLKVRYPVYPATAYPEFHGKSLFDMLEDAKKEKPMRKEETTEKFWIIIATNGPQCGGGSKVYSSQMEAESAAQDIVEAYGGSANVLEAITNFQSQAKITPLKP